MLPDYFTFYEIPISFKIDQAGLKKTFYTYSRKYHPDFHTQVDSAKQEEILELSTHNNKAYNTLRDFDLRMAYILKLKNVMEDEGQNKLPQDFLIEMMDINEELMEVQMDPDPTRLENLIKDLDKKENEYFQVIAPIIENYSGDDATDLQPIKEYYLKKKYITRIKNRLASNDVEI